MTTLPVVPSSVTDLHISAGPDLVSLPDVPAGAQTVYLIGANGLAIPAIPSGVTRLSLHSFDATSFADWPAGVRHVGLMGFDNVTALPDWPGTVETVTMWNFPALGTLPQWPMNMGSIWLKEIGATLLPQWPESVQIINLEILDVYALPQLPDGLTTLYISYLGNLHCLPELPASMNGLYIDVELGLPDTPTPISCLPNLPDGMYYQGGGWVVIPLEPSLLCTVLNSTCDFVNPVATGSVYWDQDASGTHEIGEPGYPYATVNVQPGNFIYGVQQTGYFELPLPLGSYTLTLASGNPYVQSISPASHTAPFTGVTDVDAGNDFGVVLQAGMQDLRVDLTNPMGRPGFETHGWLTYENYGTVEMDGSVVLQLDGDQSWVGSSPAPTLVSGNMITWAFTALAVGASQPIHFTVYTDVAVPIGTPLDHLATVEPVATDETPADNVSTVHAVTVGSYDPNDKQVVPAMLTPEQTAAGEELVYTINFQNTGTYPADRVLITDALGADLQWNTLRFMSSSHACSWVLLDDGTVRFLFDPILLPDSLSDEAGSHGFVKFGILPSPTLPLGALVENVANIIFDFNPPVVTEPALFSVQYPMGVAQVTTDDRRLYPNPVSTTLWLHMGSGADQGLAEILDPSGRVLLAQRLDADRSAVDVSGLAAGAYHVRVRTDGQVWVRTFVKY